MSRERYRELASWRKAFKQHWRYITKLPVSEDQTYQKYCPNTKKWVCGCTAFVHSRFLICKHLVQSVHPPPPIFFLEASRNRTPPFWTHPELKPVDKEAHSGMEPGQSITSPPDHEDNDLPSDTDSEDGDNIIDMLANDNIHRKTFNERLDNIIDVLKSFGKGLEYQRQFRDGRFLNVLEQEGMGMLRMARQCLERERRMNST